MNKMTISEPAKITLNGYQFEFRPGDDFNVIDKEEAIGVIEENIDQDKELLHDMKTELEEYNRDIDYWSKELNTNFSLNDEEISKIENKLKQLKSDKELHIKAMNKIRQKIARQVRDLSSSGPIGYRKARKLVRGVEADVAAAEKEREKQKAAGNIEMLRNNLGDARDKYVEANTDFETFMKENNIEMRGDEPYVMVRNEDGDERFERLSEFEYSDVAREYDAHHREKSVAQDQYELALNRLSEKLPPAEQKRLEREVEDLTDEEYAEDEIAGDEFLVHTQEEGESGSLLSTIMGGDPFEKIDIEKTLEVAERLRGDFIPDEIAMTKAEIRDQLSTIAA